MNAPIILARDVRAIGLPHDHPAIVYLLGLTAGSRATQIRGLRRAAQILGSPLGSVAWAELGAQQMAALRARLAELHSPSYANLTLTAVRGVQRCAVRLGTMDPAAFERAHVQAIKGRRVKPGRSLAPYELRGLFSSAREQSDGVGLRLCAILALGYGCGLRRSEIAAVRLDGYSAAAVRFLGKGNHEREVPLAAGAVRALASWLTWRGTEPGFLVCGIHRYPPPGRPDHERPMHPSSIYRSLRRLGARAKVARFTPHDLRRTFAGDLLDHGVDLRTVQGLMGHADPVTTSGYDRRGARVLAEAVSRLDVPHV